MQSRIQCTQCSAGVWTDHQAGAVGFVSRFSVPSVRAVLSFIFAPQALTTFRSQSPAAVAFFSAPTFSLAAHNVISDVFSQSNPFTILVHRRNPASKATPALSIFETQRECLSEAIISFLLFDRHEPQLHCKRLFSRLSVFRYPLILNPSFA